MAADGAAPALADSFGRRSVPDFLTVQEALRRGNFVGAQRQLREVASTAEPGFCHFALRALLELEASQEKSPQAVALLADLGAASDVQGGARAQQLALGVEGEEVVMRLARMPGHLKTVVKVVEAWRACADPALLAAETREALARAVRREALGELGAEADPTSATGHVAAAFALTAMPWLLEEAAAREVLAAVDDGSRDDVAEKLTARLSRDVQIFFVERRRSSERLKAAARAAKALCLEGEFPTLDLEYRTKALENALRHNVREAAVGLTLGEPRLYRQCVEGLLRIEEAVLGLELAGAWSVELSADVRNAATAAIEASAGRYLAPPEAFQIHVVDTEAAAHDMGRALLSRVDVPGLAAVLLQVSTLEAAFLVDLPALGSSEALAGALEGAFCEPRIVKVGFGGFEDLGKIGGGFPRLARACGVAPNRPGARDNGVVDLQQLEVERRVKEEGASKKHAREKLSLSSLAEQFLGLPLDKSLQLCDWGRRPISAAQARYAALDAYAPAKIYAQAFASAPP
eukprot:CAMPEP_0177268642 /NCGR_PEP_ID=MMETSP0367-20130122/63923_1 /TAXON_ID=447022 ORGANISM="Scrippsiella hangoei-like, Strain SHHI-4" /NCGR_SAMPLE_ID=MMETSP0367 /ASSEMBLY_ACC=CAM_ASM_000362 /LENGTH=518 /DNA_ID=CAMNT_0018724285 /DNA_START=58 /DNA_END=1615 /DNA_ORIENTATION=+